MITAEGKLGFAFKTGGFAIQPQYNDAGNFDKALCPVERAGNVIVPLAYTEIYHQRGKPGRVWVSRNGKPEYLDMRPFVLEKE